MYFRHKVDFAIFIESNSAAFQPTITLYQNEFITIFDTVYFAKAINI